MTMCYHQRLRFCHIDMTPHYSETCWNFQQKTRGWTHRLGWWKNGVDCWAGRRKWKFHGQGSADKFCGDVSGSTAWPKWDKSSCWFLYYPFVAMVHLILQAPWCLSSKASGFPVVWWGVSDQNLIKVWISQVSLVTWFLQPAFVSSQV